MNNPNETLLSAILEPLGVVIVLAFMFLIGVVYVFISEYIKMKLHERKVKVTKVTKERS